MIGNVIKSDYRLNRRRTTFDGEHFSFSTSAVCTAALLIQPY